MSFVRTEASRRTGNCSTVRCAIPSVTNCAIHLLFPQDLCVGPSRRRILNFVTHARVARKLCFQFPFHSDKQGRMTIKQATSKKTCQASNQNSLPFRHDEHKK